MKNHEKAAEKAKREFVRPGSMWYVDENAIFYDMDTDSIVGIMVMPLDEERSQVALATNGGVNIVLRPMHRKAAAAAAKEIRRYKTFDRFSRSGTLPLHQLLDAIEAHIENQPKIKLADA